VFFLSSSKSLSYSSSEANLVLVWFRAWSYPSSSVLIVTYRRSRRLFLMALITSFLPGASFSCSLSSCDLSQCRAISKGMLPSLFVRSVLASNSSFKYFTMRMCPFFAAKWRGVFLFSTVYELTSLPSLARILTKSRSPSLAATHIILKPSLVLGSLQMLKAILFWLFLASRSLGSLSAENDSSYLQTLGCPLYAA